MPLFKSKFKKVEPQNVTAMPQAEEAPAVQPKIPSPAMIANISKAVIDNMALPELPKENDKSKSINDEIKILTNEIKELEFELRVKKETLRILSKL